MINCLYLGTIFFNVFTYSIFQIHNFIIPLLKANCQYIRLYDLNDIQVVLLEGAYDTKKETDGTVPWADGFSIYPLRQQELVQAFGQAVPYKHCTDHQEKQTF